jgi:hypothetical protein
MARALRWIGYPVGLPLVLALVAAATTWLMASSKLNARPQAEAEGN